MAITIEEATAFVKSAEKYREDWLKLAKRSWGELKKRQTDGRLWGISPNAIKRRSRYPAWYSIFKIRQPLLLSRIGIPIGKDTTQDGNDNIGATAAICLERLAVNLARSFDFFDYCARVRDDFLATNVGQGRAYYERDEIKQRVKEYITPQQMPGSQDIVFVDGGGKIIETDDISQDDEGYFIQVDELVDIENEKVCMEPLLYTEFLVEPDIRRWERCKRLAFVLHYSEPEFKEIFGLDAYNDLAKPDPSKVGGDEAAPKLQNIKVYEYWDYYEEECLWFAENGSKFIKPKKYALPDVDEDNEMDQQPNGLYDLEGFFPCPPPLISHQSTDEFWPTPEYFQLAEIFEDIHTIFSRMMALTRAIRARLLFDNNIDQLQEALNEATEGDAFGVANLTQALVASGGSLDNVVQYIPTEKLIESLNNLYTALEQRLNVIYKLTGTSDLIQGLITDPTQRTFGERQMLEKYALNQMAEPQRKMQEFVRASYELMCEMAIKNFKDASLDMYIMPQTLQPEHQQRYRAALEMLKNNRKRFRIELETDSTIALNEEYDKQMRIELVNALTTALEKTANVAQQSPALVVPELHALKYLIQGYRQGKMFQQEVTQAIDNVIKQAEEAKQQQPFNKDETMAKLKAQELQAANQVAIAELQSKEKIEIAKLQQNERLAGIEAQLEQFKQMSQTQKDQGDLQAKFAIIQSDIIAAREELALKRDELLVELRKVTDKKEVDQFKLMLDERVSAYEMQLGQQEQALLTYKTQLDEQEKYATEARLQSEHELEKVLTKVEILTQLKQMEPQPQEAPVVNVTLPEPKPVSKRRYTKVKRNKDGLITDLEHQDAVEG